MAFKNVNSFFDGETVKAKDLKLGEPLEAYVISYDEYSKTDDRGNEQSFHNLMMQKKDGEQFKLQTCGNLSYMVKDRKVKVGLLTQITKTADMNKTNKRTQFDVLQDADDTIATAPAAEASVDPIDVALGAADGKADRVASVTKATEQGIVAAQAKKLAQQHTKRG